MRLLRAAFLAAILTGVSSAAILPGRLGLGFFAQPSGGGKTLVFNYPSFSSSIVPSQIQVLTNYGGLSGSAIDLIFANSGHSDGAAWYNTQQDISQGFTTTFTFQITGVTTNSPPTTSCLTFVMDTDPRGEVISGDANTCGYGAYEQSSGNIPISNSIGVKFDINGNGFYTAPASGYSNSTGLYMDGGFADAMIPMQDLNPYSVNINSGDVMSATLVYDGNTLTEVLTDTVTGASARYSWPVDIQTFTGNPVWMGISAGQVANTAITLLSWNYYKGYDTRLSAPTFSVAAGQYSSSQTVSLSGPAGASIYYTTNGLEPTSASTLYSGTPLTVSQDTVVKAISIESNYTDSAVATANYQIASSGTPIINFPSGFANYAGLINLVGRTTLSTSSLILTDGTGPPSYGEVGGFWYVAPVTVSSFTTNFQFNLNGGTARGIAFVIQNQPPASAGTSVSGVTGGPFAFSSGANASVDSVGFGGNGIVNQGGTLTTPQTLGLANSVAVIFAPLGGSGAYTGVYTDGATPSTATATNIGGTLNFQSGHSFNVQLTYDGTNLSISITDATTSANYSTSVPIDIPTTVGGTTAFVGFTGADYSGAAQQVNSWTYSQ